MNRLRLPSIIWALLWLAFGSHVAWRHWEDYRAAEPDGSFGSFAALVLRDLMQVAPWVILAVATFAGAVFIDRRLRALGPSQAAKVLPLMAGAAAIAIAVTGWLTWRQSLLADPVIGVALWLAVQTARVAHLGPDAERAKERR